MSLGGKHPPPATGKHKASPLTPKLPTLHATHSVARCHSAAGRVNTVNHDNQVHMRVFLSRFLLRSLANGPEDKVVVLVVADGHGRVQDVADRAQELVALLFEHCGFSAGDSSSGGQRQRSASERMTEDSSPCKLAPGNLLKVLVTDTVDLARQLLQLLDAQDVKVSLDERLGVVQLAVTPGQVRGGRWGGV